jgi:5-methylcytosine-specific restriction endonuclease McrA
MAARNTATRDRDRAYIRRTKPACGICQGEIDYNLHWRDPMSFVVDHIVPLARGGSDTRDNKQAAHRHCNRQKSDKLEEEMATLQPIRTFVTARTW